MTLMNHELLGNPLSAWLAAAGVAAAINLAMVRGFAKEGIEFAVLTRTVVERAADTEEEETAPRYKGPEKMQPASRPS